LAGRRERVVAGKKNVGTWGRGKKREAEWGWGAWAEFVVLIKGFEGHLERGERETCP